MNHIKDLVKGMAKDKDEIVYIYKGKQEDHILNEQDKFHIRAMSILQLAHNKELFEYVMSHEVKERFEYDKAENVVYYKLKFIKERRKYRGDA